MKNIFFSFAGFASASGLHRGGRDDRPYLFLLFSAVIHILVLWALTSFSAGSLKLFRIPLEPPLEIDIVELPENITGKLKVPDKVTAYAQRSQEVEKEEYPKRSESVNLTPATPAAKPLVIAVVNPGGAESKGSAAIKRPAQREVQDKAKDEGITIVDEADSAPSLMPEILRPESGLNKKAGTGAGEGSVRLFPTEGSLQQIARAENKGIDSPKEGSGMTLLLNTSEFKYQKYFIAIKRRIEFFWEYPPLAARNGQQGRLSIDFVIHKDGTIEVDEINIIKSSNYPILDDAATTALRLASPFNPFPEDFDIEKITVHGSFEYSLIRRKR
jgi:TonB family protein